MKRPPPESCAICGEDIPPTAHACPHCGADERNGWRDQDPYDGLELPDDDAERGRPPGALPRWLIITVGILLLVVLAMGILGIRG